MHVNQDFVHLVQERENLKKTKYRGPESAMANLLEAECRKLLIYHKVPTFQLSLNVQLLGQSWGDLVHVLKRGLCMLAVVCVPQIHHHFPK